MLDGVTAIPVILSKILSGTIRIEWNTLGLQDSFSLTKMHILIKVVGIIVRILRLLKTLL